MIMTSEEELRTQAEEMKDDLKMYRVDDRGTIERVWLSVDADFMIANTQAALELFNEMCEFYDDMDTVKDKCINHFMGWNHITEEWDRIKAMDDIIIHKFF